MLGIARRLALVSGLALAALLLVQPSDVFAQAGAAGTASGSYSIDGKKVELHHAYAMSQPNTFDEKKNDVAILLTEKPLPEGSLASLKELGDAQRGQPRNSVLLTIDDSGRGIREVINHLSLGDASLQMSGMTHSDIAVAAHTPERISGTAKTKAPEDFLKHKYALDARFDAPIVQAKRDDPLPDAKTGKKLPRGGGEPGKAYLAFEAAVQRKDIAAVRKLKPADMPDMPDEELKQGLEIMAAMSPTKVTVDDGYIAGDTAALYVSGLEEGQKRYATVRMVKGPDGIWRAVQQKWSDKPPGK